MDYYYGIPTGMLPLLLFGLTVTLRFQSMAAATLPGPGCPKRCGDVDIVFPFGIGAECAMEGFVLHCNETREGQAWYNDVPVMNVSLLHGQVRMKNRIAFMCSHPSTRTADVGGALYLNLSGTPFTFSTELNKFTVVGGNALAYMIGSTYVLGCLSTSWPYNVDKAQDGSPCTGVGCCQVDLTSNMSYYRVYFNKDYNMTDQKNSAGYCAYGAMMETEAFKFSTKYLNTSIFWDEHDGRVPVILDWAVGNESCDVASKNADSYACRSTNSRCVESSNGSGYLCNCTDGYSGNPYITDGCQDIDECAVNVPRPCPGQCTNIPGNYSCPDEKPPGSSGTVVLAVGISVGAKADRPLR